MDNTVSFYVCKKCETGFINNGLYGKCPTCSSNLEKRNIPEIDYIIATNKTIIELIETYANLIASKGNSFILYNLLKEDIKEIYSDLGIKNISNFALIIPKPKNIFKRLLYWIKHWFSSNGYNYNFFKVNVIVNGICVTIEANKIKDKWNITQTTGVDLL